MRTSKVCSQCPLAQTKQHSQCIYTQYTCAQLKCCPLPGLRPIVGLLSSRCLTTGTALGVSPLLPGLGGSPLVPALSASQPLPALLRHHWYPLSVPHHCYPPCCLTTAASRGVVGQLEDSGPRRRHTLRKYADSFPTEPQEIREAFEMVAAVCVAACVAVCVAAVCVCC